MRSALRTFVRDLHDGLSAALGDDYLAVLGVLGWVLWVLTVMAVAQNVFGMPS